MVHFTAAVYIPYALHMASSTMAIPPIAMSKSALWSKSGKISSGSVSFQTEPTNSAMPTRAGMDNTTHWMGAADRGDEVAIIFTEIGRRTH